MGPFEALVKTKTRKLSKREVYLLGAAKAQLDAAVHQLREAVMNLRAVGADAIGSDAYDALGAAVVACGLTDDLAKEWTT